MSGYDLSNVDEIVAFDGACCDAASGCPQWSGASVTEYESPVSAAWLFRRWFMDDTLWSLVWSDHLGSRARETFERYALIRDGRILDTETGKFFYLNDRFRIDTKYSRRTT